MESLIVEADPLVAERSLDRARFGSASAARRWRVRKQPGVERDVEAEAEADRLRSLSALDSFLRV